MGTMRLRTLIMLVYGGISVSVLWKVKECTWDDSRAGSSCFASKTPQTCVYSDWWRQCRPSLLWTIPRHEHVACWLHLVAG